jgi:hypothetical protein
MAVPMSDIDTWARGIVLPTCVGIGFVNTNGYLPRNIPELEGWGNATGRRNPSTGAWTCRPEDNTLRATPTGSSGTPGVIGAGAGARNPFDAIAASLGVDSSVLMLGGVALLAVMLLRKR